MRPHNSQSVVKGKRPASPVRGAVPKKSKETVYDSDSSFELDDTVFDTDNPDRPEGEVYRLPAEMEVEEEREDAPFDLSSNEGEDHTGFWAEEDLRCLFLAVNNHRSELKGNFIGASGGKRRRDTGWDAVKDYVNKRCSTAWTVKQCKNKMKKFCQEAKEKYNAFRKELFKTGGGIVDDDMYLTELEELALEYVGIEGVFGIPGIHAVALVPDEDQSYLNMEEDAAMNVWDFTVSKSSLYSDLPKTKLRISKPKRKTPRSSKK